MRLMIFKNPCGRGATTSKGLCHFYFDTLKAVTGATRCIITLVICNLKSCSTQHNR